MEGAQERRHSQRWRDVPGSHQSPSTHQSRRQPSRASTQRRQDDEERHHSRLTRHPPVCRCRQMGDALSQILKTQMSIWRSIIGVLFCSVLGYK